MSHETKQRIYEQFARVGKALAAPARLELLDLLAQGERPVEALAGQAHLSVANASQHLRVLHAARLVDFRRDGQSIIYRLAGPRVEDLWHALRGVAEAQLAELDGVARAYLDGRDDFEPIARKDLLRRLEEGTVTLIDVRPYEEYAQGHLPGAVDCATTQQKLRVEQHHTPYGVDATDQGPAGRSTASSAPGESE